MAIVLHRTRNNLYVPAEERSFCASSRYSVYSRRHAPNLANGPQIAACSRPLRGCGGAVVRTDEQWVGVPGCSPHDLPSSGDCRFPILGSTPGDLWRTGCGRNLCGVAVSPHWELCDSEFGRSAHTPGVPIGRAWNRVPFSPRFIANGVGNRKAMAQFAQTGLAQAQEFRITEHLRIPT